MRAAFASPPPWSTAGAIAAPYDFNSLGIKALNGSVFPGNGADALFSQEMQSGGDDWAVRLCGDSASSRTSATGRLAETLSRQANWANSGSGHHDDEADVWITGQLLLLPYSDAAVKRATVQTETLRP